MKSIKYDKCDRLNKIYCLSIINNLHLYDNCYSFAYKINNLLGNNIKIIDDNYQLRDKTLVRDFYERDEIGKYLLENKFVCYLCDYIRLKLIEEYNFPNFMDLDCILYNKNQLSEYIYHHSVNQSTFLIKSQYTKLMYRYLLNNYKTYLGDGSYKISIHTNETIYPVYRGMSFNIKNLKYGYKFFNKVPEEVFLTDNYLYDPIIPDYVTEDKLYTWFCKGIKRYDN